MTSHLTRLSMRLALLPALLGVLILAACAIAPLPLRIEQRIAISGLPQSDSAHATHALALDIADIGGWSDPEIIAAVHQAAHLLAQCGIRITRAELLRVSVAEPYRYFSTPRSRELARALQLDKPAVYFSAGTRQLPAFDAEAIGRGNSRSRPELADTVWIARGARDLGIVLAHELAHVLMDSGAHDNTPGNLMAESTTQGNTRLSEEQCTRIRVTGARNGLLHPGVN